MPALDGLRGLAIVMVLFVHFIGDATPHSALERLSVKLANYGIWGVDLFFVLSGFLITGILYDSRRSQHYFKNFYIRRTLRIFPLYYGVLLLLFGVLPLLSGHYPQSLSGTAHHQGWLWSYTTNVYLAVKGTWALPYVGHFWSLAVEEHFYLLWPIFVLFLSRRALLRVCVAGSLFALGLRMALAHAGATHVTLVVFTPCRLDALLIGAFLAISVRDVGFERVTRTMRPLLFVFAGMVLATSAWHALGGGLDSIVIPLRGTFVALTFGALLVTGLDVSPRSLLGRVLHSGSARTLGKYSYGLYVFHGIIAYALVEKAVGDRLAVKLGTHMGATLIVAVVGAIASFLVAAASYELYEKRFLRLKERFAPSESRKAVVAPRPAVATASPMPGRAAKLGFAVVLASCVPARDASVAHAAPASAQAVPTARVAVDASAPAQVGTARFIEPNPVISRGKPVESWSPRLFAHASAVVDGSRSTAWNAGKPSPGRPAWVAIDVGRGPSRALVTWSSAGSFNYDETDYGSPGSYGIETSPNSSDGEDGTWKTVATVRSVTTHGAAHSFDFAGQRWVKFVVTSAPAKSPNGVQIDRIDVHDISAGASDTWFFMGDSITAFAFGSSVPTGQGFAADVHAKHPAYYPAVINGGIGGDKAEEGVKHIDKWLRDNPDARFWAIGYGSNDSAGDSTDTASFRTNMQTIIDRIKAAGHVPILARIPYSTDGNHSTIREFNAVVDQLRRDNGLPAGPDLYDWFMKHPDQLRDGLHPNDKGIVAINRLWAEAIDPLYRRSAAGPARR